MAAFAALLYAANLLAALLLHLAAASPVVPWATACVQLSAIIITGVALWFVIIQLALGRFCRYCLLLHGVGLLFAAACPDCHPRQKSGHEGQ